ncbi:hypothetical protein LLG46_09245 [bacterium]|nr:hypothetical protein [bacterium]
MRRIAYIILIMFLLTGLTAISMNAEETASSEGMLSNMALRLSSSSTLSSIMYMSENSLTSTSNSTNSLSSALKKDNYLMLQNADLGLGKLKLKLGFQDIGEDFDGSDSLRSSNAIANDALNQIQKEKGIKRMNFSGEMPTSGLSFLFNQIDDANDYIRNWMLGYKVGGLGFTYTSSDVGNDFDRFTDLKESNRAQLANQIGTKRTQYAVQYGAGPTNSALSSLCMSQIDSENGVLTQNSGDINVGSVKVHAYVRDADPTFDQFKAMNNDDRTQLALNARRQFDPSVQSSSVTGTDKSKVTSETGLDRANYSVEVATGQVSTWLSYLGLNSTNGDLSRGAVTMKGKNFGLYFNHHDIDSKFTKLSSLQPVEVSNFGNEYGMSRSGAGGTFKLGFGELALNTVNIKDNDGASISKQSLGFKNTALKVNINHQNIDPDFDRISDLSTIDKADMVDDDSGYRWSDYSVNFQATKVLNIDSYVYDSVNHTTGDSRNQNRLSLKYAADGNSTYMMDVINVDYGNGDFVNTQSLGMSKKVTGNLAVVTKIARITRDSDDTTTAGTLGFDWSVGKKLTVSANISNANSGINDLQKNRKVALNGLIAKQFLFFKNITVGTGMNTTSLKGSQTACDNAFKMQTGVIGNGTFMIDNSDKINRNTGLYNNSRIIKYESDADKKKPLHVKMLRQNVVTSTTTSVDKRSYSAELLLSKSSSFTYKDQLADTNSAGTISTIAENAYQINHKLSEKLNITADYTTQINATTNKWAHIMGMGFAGKLSNNTDVEVYYGICHIADADGANSGVYKIKYNRKLDDNHYISFSTQRKSDCDATIDVDEGRTIARLDFKTIFH